MEGFPHFYRDQKRLVFRKGVMWPSQCIKTNKPLQENEKVRKKIYWNIPYLALLVFVSPFIYILVALLTRKQYEDFFPICSEFNKKRKLHVFFGVIVMLLGFVLFGIAAAEESLIVLMAPASLIVLGSIIFLIMKRLIVPTKISENFVWIKGVNKDFLMSLPEWHPSYEYGGEPLAAVFD